MNDVVKPSLQDLDGILDDIISRYFGSDGFSPDLIIGLTKSGAILGKILSMKLETDFQPLYIKNRKVLIPNQLQITESKKSILIVDDFVDTGGTLVECLKEIVFSYDPGFEEIRDMLDYENLRNLLKSVPINVKIFTLVFDKISAIPVDFFRYQHEKENIELPWKGLDIASQKDIFLNARINWSNDIVELIEDISEKYKLESLPKAFHQNHIEKYLNEIVAEMFNKVVYEVEISGKRNFDEEEFLQIFENSGFVPIKPVSSVRYRRISKDYHFQMLDFKYTVLLKEKTSVIKLTFDPDYLRSYEKMCSNCSIKTNDSRCNVCDAFHRSLILLKDIYNILKSEYGVISIQCHLVDQNNNKKLKIEQIEEIIPLV